MVDAFVNTNKSAINAKAYASNLSANSLTGPTPRSNLVGLHSTLSGAIDLWNHTKTISGMEAYSRDQFDDPTLDVAVEFNAMIDAAVSLRDWIFNNFPTDSVSGAIAEKVLNPAGGADELDFTTAQLADFRTEVDLFTATIS
jgi:hypothetical protein